MKQVEIKLNDETWEKAMLEEWQPTPYGTREAIVHFNGTVYKLRACDVREVGE